MIYFLLLCCDVDKAIKMFRETKCNKMHIWGGTKQGTLYGFEAA